MSVCVASSGHTVLLKLKRNVFKTPQKVGVRSSSFPVVLSML